MSKLSGAGSLTTLIGEPALLVEFSELWSRGLADPDKLWELFDACEMYMYKPEMYFGAPMFGIDQQLVTPVFSSEDELTRFMSTTTNFEADRVREGFDWVLLTGAQFFALPVRARWLAIDPSGSPEMLIDLSSRDPQPELVGGAPSMLINLEANARGEIFQRFAGRPEEERD